MGKSPNRKRPTRRESVTFAWDPNDASQLARLRAEAEQAKARAEGRFAQPADASLSAAAAEAVEEFLGTIATITFDLRSCGVTRSTEIEAAHPPTKDQQKRAAKLYEAAGRQVPLLAYDEDTYPAALIAECCTRIVVTGDDGWSIDDPDEITAELIGELIYDDAADGWSENDRQILLGTCRSLTTHETLVPADLVQHLGNG